MNIKLSVWVLVFVCDSNTVQSRYYNTEIGHFLHWPIDGGPSNDRNIIITNLIIMGYFLHVLVYFFKHLLLMS